MYCHKVNLQIRTVIPKVCSADHWWSAKSLYGSIFCASRTTKFFEVVRQPEKFGNHWIRMNFEKNQLWPRHTKYCVKNIFSSNYCSDILKSFQTRLSKNKNIFNSHGKINYQMKNVFYNIYINILCKNLVCDVGLKKMHTVLLNICLP